MSKENNLVIDTTLSPPAYDVVYDNVEYGDITITFDGEPISADFTADHIFESDYTIVFEPETKE